MKKIQIAAMILVASVVLIQACTKEKEIVNDEKPVKLDAKREASLDSNYFPDNFEEQLQLFFDNMNEYKNDSSISFSNYDIQNGLWNITSSMSYVNTNAFE